MSQCRTWEPTRISYSTGWEGRSCGEQVTASEASHGERSESCGKGATRAIGMEIVALDIHEVAASEASRAERLRRGQLVWKLLR